MANQVALLNKMHSMYINKQIGLQQFRNCLMQCEGMVHANAANAQNGVVAKLAQLQQIAKNL